MTREEFIKILVDNGIPFATYEENGADMVYVFSKKEYELKQANPRKYKDLYIPYIRVSHFDEDRWYTRENGYCCYMNKQRVIDIVMNIGS